MQELFDSLPDGLLTEILKQFGIVVILTMAATEYFFPARGKWKRLTALLWACGFSYIGWLIGAIQLPAIVHDNLAIKCEGVCIHQYIVLFGCAIASTVLAFGSHEILSRLFGKKRNDRSRLPQ